MKAMKLIAVGLVVSAMAPVGLAWEVQQWGDQGILLTTESVNKSVLLQSSGTYKLYALEGGALDSIGAITIDPSVTGPVTVHILRNDGTNGVVNLGSVNLSNASPGRLAECRVQNNAGVGGSIVADELVGPMIVGGSVLSTVNMTSLKGSVVCASLSDFTATVGATVPEITVASNYAGVMTITPAPRTFCSLPR